MKVLVTGGMGRIGRVQTQTLRDAGHEVRTFDQKEPEAKPDWEHVTGDLRDQDTVRKALDGMQSVIHLGAIASDWDRHDHEVMEINVMGTWNVLQGCIDTGIGRAICFSSIQALGNVGGLRFASEFPVDETYRRHPLTAYQLSKHLGEEMCQSFTDRFGLSTISLLPVFVTHPDQYERWQTNPPDEAAPAIASNYWAYVDVRDVCAAALLSLSAYGGGHGAFILAAEDTLARTPTAELIKREFPGIPWTSVTIEEYLASNPYRCPIDASRARRVLRWRPQFTWREPQNLS